MTTIMTDHTNGRVRTCSATCHKARRPGCRCICRGQYHGRGSSQLAAQALREDIKAGFLGKEIAQLASDLEITK